MSARLASPATNDVRQTKTDVGIDAGDPFVPTTGIFAVVTSPATAASTSEFAIPTSTSYEPDFKALRTAAIPDAVVAPSSIVFTATVAPESVWFTCVR